MQNITVPGNRDSDTTVSATDGEVQIFSDDGDYAPPTTAFHTPAQARELADALLRAADDAEGLGTPCLVLRPVPADKIHARARERMRTHVFVKVCATDRNPDDKGYRLVGYYLFATREAWYGASDEERERAVNVAVKVVATEGGVRPSDDGAVKR
ncbi:hypothetical protein [Streptomyces sp. NPDC005302]|uniref:hypothetical protein n=1 Tax=Streptomyces sp. NPDC005302 TaxID=3154675 RepID=UPI0033B4EC04